MRIFERLVLALGHREHHHLGALAEIEHRRADEIADILDHHHRARGGLQLHQPARHHVGLEMAAGAGVDLHDRRAGGADALPVIGGRLIALEHEERQLGLQIADGALEQRGLAGTRRADEIERQDLAAGEPGAVLRRERIVLGEDARLERDQRLAMAVLVVGWSWYGRGHGRDHGRGHGSGCGVPSP